MDSIELWAGFFDVIGLGFLLLEKHQKPETLSENQVVSVYI